VSNTTPGELFNVQLTAGEAVNLVSDRPEVQAVAAAAKAALELQGELPPALAKFVASAAARAVKDKKLRWRGVSVEYCPICGWSGEYPKFKSGPRRGRPNTNKRRNTQYGVDLADSPVTINGYATLGGCSPCVEKALPCLRRALSDVRAELPRQLAGAKSYTRHALCRCTSCGWYGHEGQLGKCPTLLPGGVYPGKCPACGATNEVFGKRPIEFDNRQYALEERQIVGDPE